VLTRAVDLAADRESTGSTAHPLVLRNGLRGVRLIERFAADTMLLWLACKFAGKSSATIINNKAIA